MRLVDRGRWLDIGGADQLWSPKIRVLGRLSSAVRIAVDQSHRDQCQWPSSGGDLRGEDANESAKIGMGKLKERKNITVSPDVLESIYAVSSLLQHIFIHGQSNSKALVAVVVRPFRPSILNTCIHTNTDMSRDDDHLFNKDKPNNLSSLESMAYHEEQEVWYTMCRLFLPAIFLYFMRFEIIIVFKLTLCISNIFQFLLHYSD